MKHLKCLFKILATAILVPLWMAVFVAVWLPLMIVAMFLQLSGCVEIDTREWIGGYLSLIDRWRDL